MTTQYFIIMDTAQQKAYLLDILDAMPDKGSIMQDIQTYIKSDTNNDLTSDYFVRIRTMIQDVIMTQTQQATQHRLRMIKQREHKEKKLDLEAMLATV